jgi:hypothetical protein
MPDANDTSGSDAGADDRADQRTRRRSRAKRRSKAKTETSNPTKDVPDWVAVKVQREQRYQRFRDRQTALGTRGFVALAKMAQSYAEESLRTDPVKPKSEEERAERLEKYRLVAYRYLADDILGHRRFARAGRLQVLFLDPGGPLWRLTVEAFQQYRSVLSDPVVWVGVLRRCFVPPADAREWMEAHRLNTQVLWPEETTSSRSMVPPAAPPADAPAAMSAASPAPEPRPEAHVTLTPPPALGRRGGLDYRAESDVLAAEIIKGVKDPKDPEGKKLLEDWDACWELADRAPGKGSRETKQKRLSDRVKLLRNK